jgi:uncharacterized protein YkwD
VPPIDIAADPDRGRPGVRPRPNDIATPGRTPAPRPRLAAGGAITLVAAALAFAAVAPTAGAATPGLTADEVEALRDKAVALINADRAAEGLAPVERDPAMDAIGDRFCEQALASGVIGHYLTDGLSPYERYAAWSGSSDCTGQNACSTYDVRGQTWDFDRLSAKLVEYERMMISERPPDDGHRRNILSPWHTHVGLGLAWGPEGIRMSQEFVNRYVELDHPPRHATLDATPLLRGRILDPAHYELAGITVFYAPPPRALSLAEATARTSYGLPAEHRFLRLRLPQGRFYTDTRSRGDIAVDEDGGFSCALHFYAVEPGIYGVMVRLHPRGAPDETQVPATYACVRVGMPPVPTSGVVRVIEGAPPQP